MKKNITAAIMAAIMLCFCLSSSALEMSEQFYANDTSGILTAETEEYICQENYRLYDLCKGAEVVVVTVDFLDGYTAEEYGYTVFNDWGLGDPDENNGLLILLCPGEETYWVTPGTGMAQILTPGRLDTILAENMEQTFASENYDRAAYDTFRAVVAEIDSYYGVTEADSEAWYSGGYYDDGYSDDGYYEDESGPMHSPFAWVALIVALTLFISVFSIFRSIFRRRVYGVYTPPRTTRTYIPRRTGFFSSGYSGRTSRPSAGSFRPSHTSRPSRPSRPSGGGRRGGGGSSRGGGAGRR